MERVSHIGQEDEVVLLFVLYLFKELLRVFKGDGGIGCAVKEGDGAGIYRLP